MARFRAVDRHDPPRRELQQLPADFRADASGAAGYQYDLSVYPLPDVVDGQFYRFTLQEILDRDGLGLHDQVPVDQLPVTGQHANFEMAVLGLVDELPQFFPGKRSLCHEDLPCRIALDKPPRFSYNADYRHAVDSAPTSLASQFIKPTTRYLGLPTCRIALRIKAPVSSVPAINTRTCPAGRDRSQMVSFQPRTSSASRPQPRLSFPNRAPGRCGVLRVWEQADKISGLR